MKTLLIPTDFSETSKDAFRCGVRLAQRIEANITVVHILEENYINMYNGTDLLKTKALLKEALKLFAVIENAKRKKHLPKIKTEIHECSGEIGDKIIELSKSPDIDVVVMGATGANQMLDKWFGTVSTYVAQNAFCPVLLVPNGTIYRNPKRLLFAHDLDQPTHVAVLERIDFIAKCFDAKVHNLFVNTRGNQDEKIEKLVNREWNLSESARFSFKTVVLKHKSVLDTIQMYAITHRIDMMMVSTYHRPFLEQIFDENMTRQIALYAKLPLFILHLEDKFSLF